MPAIDSATLTIVPGLAGYHLVKAGTPKSQGVLAVTVAACKEKARALAMIADINSSYPHQRLTIVGDVVHIQQRKSKKAAAEAKGGGQ